MEATQTLTSEAGRLGIGVMSEGVAPLLSIAAETGYVSAREARAEALSRDPGFVRATDITLEAMYGNTRRGVARFREAISTGELGTYFGDVIDRVVLARYTQWIPEFRRYCKTGTFADLTRNKRQVQFGGGDELLGQVGQGGPYPTRGTTPREFTWGGAKYGADFRIFWETILADDLNGLADLPNVLASSARATEARFATALFVDANGPHASLYTVGNGNKGTAALSITSLKAAVTAMSEMVDPVSGNPIFNRPRYLVVGPGLEITAREIVESAAVTYAATAGAASPLATTNIISKLGLEVLVNPWIPLIATNATDSWFLFSEPNSGPLGPGIAAFEFDTLRGMDRPLLLQERASHQLPGGGADPRGELNAVDTGSFRVIHAMGGSRLFPQATYGSDGSA